jgi:eukaryotic-like serine/threonine-protein kinase
MDTDRWQRIQTLFHQAVDLPEEDLPAFLKAACNGDGSLIADVQAMLEADSKGDSLLDHDMANVAHQMLAADSAAPVAKEFGPYVVKELLGEGGMGVVYLAERKDLGNLVAIKILRDAWLSPARRERFASEQRMLAQLNHPSIARLYDADTLPDGTPWFVMEYVEGMPITDYCQKYNCSIERRLQLFRQICEAVQYAHAHAVIHRDLKPSNIFVKPDGGVRLLDFGIAKQIQDLDSSVDQTRTVMRMMTPAYASPEQIRGNSVGVQTDVYSLGVILYQLLADCLPFDFSNLATAEAAAIIASHEPGKPSTKAQSLGATVSKAAWADLDVLCLTAMHKDLQRRYQSVEALVRDINHYLSGEPLEARPDSVSYRLGKFVKRNQSTVSAVAAVFVVVVGLVVFFTVRLTKARNAALSEAARTQRIQSFMMNLFEGGDETTGPADDMRVITLIDRGTQQARALDGEPAVQAELYQTLGSIYQNLGKLETAEKLINTSLEQRKKLFGQDSAEVAETLMQLSLVRDYQAQYDEAESIARQALEMSKRHLSPDHPQVAKATSALGKILEDRGEYDKAIPVLEEAMRLQTKPEGPTPELSGTISELANCHFYAGHYDISNSLNLRALTMDRELYGDRHPHISDDLINLGAIQAEKSQYAQAEKYYREGLDIIQSFYGKDHPETASALTMIARVLIPQNRLSEAESMLREALEIEERVYGKVHPRVASTLNEMGTIARQQGKFKDAEADYTRMADIYREVYNGKHYYIGIALANLGGVYGEQKQYARAENFYRQALQMYGQTLPPDHQNVGITKVRLGRALLLQHRYSDAETESRGGYEILLKTNPDAHWTKNARKDLAEEYEALNQPEKAAPFRAALGNPETQPASEISKK